jgi:hypothetical protein
MTTTEAPTTGTNGTIVSTTADATTTVTAATTEKPFTESTTAPTGNEFKNIQIVKFLLIEFSIVKARNVRTLWADATCGLTMVSARTASI